jgi:hypothetical protein
LLNNCSSDAPKPPPTEKHGDPEEVDISEHYYQPAKAGYRNDGQPINPERFAEDFNVAQQRGSQGPQMTDDQLRQMMLGLDPSGLPPQGGAQNPFAGFPGMGGIPGMEGMGGPGGPPADDPMMAMLQQMMGGVPGEGTDGMPSFPGMPGQAAAPDPYAYIWRLVHAVFALGLGIYIAFTTTFTGTLAERQRSALSYNTESDKLNPGSVHFFWIFATAELILQSSRFFLEKGGVQPTGIMATVNQFLPPVWKNYLSLFLRYARIWTTVTGDAVACVFILGVCVWLRGGQAA